MDTLYWIMEYMKVFCAYLSLMFLWPSVVFYGHLKKKTGIYRFGFCVSVPIIICNTIVLLFGLFHVQNQWIIVLVFYGTFAVAVIKNAAVCLNCKKKEWFRNQVTSVLKNQGLLLAVLVYGMIYFSYGAFQIHSYGYGDLYVHHEWIYGLMEGKIFTGGVYPEAMHCFIYCMNTLTGVRVYSILLFLQGIHVAVFLISVYLLLRRVFGWRYTPVFVLMLFLTLDLCNADLIHSMFRLQITMPMEFGLHTICLSALYLSEYLNDRQIAADEKKNVRYCWNDSLFLFMTTLAAAFMIHFHVLIMAVIVCAAFAVFAWKKIFCRRYLIPLLLSGFCACFIAVIPMAGAMTQGIPLNNSIDWAVNAMYGFDGREIRSQQHIRMEDGEAVREEQKETNIFNVLPEIYEEGYVALYGVKSGRYFFLLTLVTAGFCFFVRNKPRFQRMKDICSGYPPVLLISVLYVLIYAAPMIGQPDLIPEGRFFAPGHMMILATMVMPCDAFFCRLSGFCSEIFLKRLSVGAVAGIYVAVIAAGDFRGYLFYELTRYNAAVKVTNSIIDACAPHSYTIVSPTDELYQVIQYGWHEELLSFIEKSGREEYTIPSEYVFIYVEKEPILYAQSSFFQGPSWIGEEKYLTPYWGIYSLKYPDNEAVQSPKISTSHISEQAAEQDMPDYNNPWMIYAELQNRTVLESKAYKWCQRFSEKYPGVLNVYYEDERFVCYCFRQNNGEALYNLGTK